MSLFSHKHSRAPPTGRPRRPRRRRTVAGPRRSCVGRTLALAAAGCCAMHFLPYAASCPPQTAIVGQPNCDELLVLLNDTAGCAHLEYAFSFNCSGCVCAPPSSSETTTTVDPAIAAQAAADQRQLMGAMWTLVAAAVVIVGIVVATLVHKMHSNAVVLPENEKRPMSDEELAKVRRAQLRMKTHRFSRSQEKLSKKSVLTMPHRELIAVRTSACPFWTCQRDIHVSPLQLLPWSSVPHVFSHPICVGVHTSHRCLHQAKCGLCILELFSRCSSRPQARWALP